MRLIGLLNYIKGEVKYPLFWSLPITLILCTLFILSGYQASLIFKAFILVAIFFSVLAFFYSWLFALTIVLLFINIENFQDVYKNIKGNYRHINSHTLEERRSSSYNHMEYKFIRDITSRFSSLSFFPTLYYPNYDFGVRALLPGYRKILQLLPRLPMVQRDDRLRGTSLRC